MDIFDLAHSVVADYERFARSFTIVPAPDILAQLDSLYAGRRFWPEPLIQINPRFKAGGSIVRFVAEKLLLPEMGSIFVDASAGADAPDKTLKQVTLERFTGHESQADRKRIAHNPPDILLTNFMMLELLLTRQDEIDRKVISNCEGLSFLVLDELHTYRSRQGADVAMLVRRVRERLVDDQGRLQCIGNSATMATLWAALWECQFAIGKGITTDHPTDCPNGLPTDRGYGTQV
ncbi:MAG TPA: DEAD/DEAH box helicase [Stellaceae bacterium]|nr:DEAD/DEAH box helicase [Stellaceae bacterium]